MFGSAITHFIIVIGLMTSGSSLVCDDPDDLNTGTCAQLSRDLERALLQDEGNLFRLRRLFFHSATAAPVLLRVFYNISFNESFTMAVDLEEIPNCSSSILNSTIELEQRNITLGWTSSGVYVVFHPTVLSIMQVQTPFAVLRIFHFTLGLRSPEADSFLWDGSYDLPTIQINLHITSMVCVPSYDVFESLLMDLNTLLNVYAGKQGELDEISKDQDELIGFTLPESHVSIEFIPLGNDILFVNLYSTFLLFLHTILVCVTTVWYYRYSGVQKWIDGVINDNEDLSVGIRLTSSTTLLSEFVIRSAVCIIWSKNSHDYAGIFLAVWFPNLQLLAVYIGLNIFLNVYILLKEGNCNPRSELRTLFTLAGTTFILIYLFFPTVILTFAYPTQMIVIFAFVVAYNFSTAIFSATIYKLYKYDSTEKINLLPVACCCSRRKMKIKKKVLHFFLLFMFLWMIIVYLHFIIIFALYFLLVGRASVISTGPAFLISLVPPAFMSVVAVFLKRVALRQEKNEEN